MDLREMTMNSIAKHNEIGSSRFSLRPATMGDLEAVTELLNISNEAVVGEGWTHMIRERQRWTEPGFDLAHSTMLAVSRAEQLNGYAAVLDTDSPPVMIVTLFCTHPENGGDAAAGSLLSWIRMRATQSLTRVPDDLRVSLRTFSRAHDQRTRAWFRQYGYLPQRKTFQMRVDLSDRPAMPALPKGIKIRSCRGKEEFRAIFDADKDGFRDHYGFVNLEDEAEYKAWLHYVESDPDFDPGLWFLAIEGDEIVGTSLCKKHSYHDESLGWVEDLLVRKPWRRRGIAFGLLLHSFNIFAERGYERVGLGVDAESLTGATGLYEKAGMRVHHELESWESELRPGKDLVIREAG